MSGSVLPAPSVVASHLSRTFGSFRAVDDVSFEVRPGEVFGFLGSNGAGKTTTIRMLCGLLAPSGGSATVMGYDVAKDVERVKRTIGYMSQRFSLYSDLTVAENLRFWGGTYSLFNRTLEARREWAITTAGLEARRHTLVRDLPGGFRQRLALVAALLHEPEVVFLDEPTGGVDPEARRRFWDLIDELAAAGRTVFVTTHYMDEAERCTRVALMHAGRLLALDTLPRLRAVFPDGAVVELRCPRPAQALPLLEAHPRVAESALFGEALHVVLREPEAAEAVRGHLESHGFTPAELRGVVPSLEDVFIHVIGEAEAGEAS